MKIFDQELFQIQLGKGVTVDIYVANIIVIEFRRKKMA